MTISELIERLKFLPNQAARVVVRGYEFGMNDVARAREITIHVDSHKGEDWVGQHWDCLDADCIATPDPDLVHESAIEIFGTNPSERS